MLSDAMSARQKLLLRCPIAERFAPLISARVTFFGLTSGCLRGHDCCSAAGTANLLPNHSCAIRSNCARDQGKIGHANICFWLNLTVFRINTCTKRVGGGSDVQKSSLCRCPVQAGRIPSCHHEGRPQEKLCSAAKEVRPEGSAGSVFGCGFSVPRPRGGVQLHP